jgi:hypothetical protein
MNSVGFVALLGLIGCVETNGAGTTTMLPPPEYLKCSSVPQELAVADLNTKKLGVYSSFGAYWAKRSERLVGRAAECKKARRR